MRRLTRICLCAAVVGLFLLAPRRAASSDLCGTDRPDGPRLAVPAGVNLGGGTSGKGLLGVEASLLHFPRRRLCEPFWGGFVDAAWDFGPRHARTAAGLEVGWMLAVLEFGYVHEFRGREGGLRAGASVSIPLGMPFTVVAVTPYVRSTTFFARNSLVWEAGALVKMPLLLFE